MPTYPIKISDSHEEKEKSLEEKLMEAQILLLAARTYITLAQGKGVYASLFYEPNRGLIGDPLTDWFIAVENVLKY